MDAHATPARDVAVVSAGEGKAGSGRLQRRDIGHHPVGEVRDQKVITTVAVEVADQEPIVGREPSPAGDVRVKAADQLETAVRGDLDESQQRDRPPRGVVDDELVAAIAIEVARHVGVAGSDAPTAGDDAGRGPDVLPSGAIGAVEADAARVDAEELTARAAGEASRDNRIERPTRCRLVLRFHL